MKKDELLFCPLGGSGEIGGNMNLYAYGKEDNQKWIIVDMGVSFADDSIPGVDLIMPDAGFIIEKKQDEDTVMEILLDFDGEDLEDTEDNFIATVPFQNLSSFVEKLKERGIEVENAEITMKADTTVPVDQEMGEKVLRILDFLDEVDDVQEVHSNAEFPNDFNPLEE